jgi:hypothetical protein
MLRLDWLAAVREPLYFCRVTQMALLRLLTNPKVMGTDILTPQDAIGVYRELRGVKEYGMPTSLPTPRDFGCRR